MKLKLIQTPPARAGRLRILGLGLLSLLFYLFLHNASDPYPNPTQPSGIAIKLRGQNRDSTAFRNFSTIARSCSPVTDKITGWSAQPPGHHYEVLYDRYFTEDIANSKLKFLEIGLGCNMDYGAGASSQIWPQLFPNGDIWFAEYDKACVDNYWNSSLPWRYVTGDQANIFDLKRWVKETGGEFDFIIDDGGHTNPQIWASFMVLFKNALKPGGVYFIEDLQVNRLEPYYDGGVPFYSGKVVLDAIVDWVDQLLVKTMRNSFNVGGGKDTYDFELPENIERIDCIRDMCAITKSMQTRKSKKPILAGKWSRR